jgi:hypothetical protein
MKDDDDCEASERRNSELAAELGLGGCSLADGEKNEGMRLVYIGREEAA